MNQITRKRIHHYTILWPNERVRAEQQIYSEIKDPIHLFLGQPLEDLKTCLSP